MFKYYAILAAFFAALTAIFSKIGIKGIDSALATAIRTAFIVILTWSIVFINGMGNELAGISKKSWLFLFLSAISTGLSWLCYFKALETGPVSLVAPLDKLSVPITIILASIFLAEPLTWQTALGGILITLGALVLVF